MASIAAATIVVAGIVATAVVGGGAVMSTIGGLVREICSFFDSVVYSFIMYLYQMILYLSNVDLSKFGGVSALVNRIYILLGIFMLFKLAFSFIQYIVSPDSFSDSSKGFGKLITNVMISLALLVATPWLFSELYQVQGYILKSNIIGSLIMGESMYIDSEGSSFSTDTINVLAKDTQFLLYGGFMSLNTSLVPECEETPIMGSVQQAGEPDCLNKLSELLNEENVKLKSFFKYKSEDGKIYDYRDIGTFSAIVNWEKDGIYYMNYLPLISTIVGGYVVFLLAVYCIDVASRAVKLLFLQMVAPLSIISYIDPKESIGNSKLSNWLKEVFSTWASLFIRILVIFLIFQLVSIIASGVFGHDGLSGINYGELGEPTGITQMFIYVLLVIGCFKFAKKVPELLESVLGIKGAGELSLNPFKTLTTGAAGAAAGAVIGGAVGSVTGAMGALAASRDNKDIGVGKTLFNTARGFVMGGAGSSLSGLRKGVSSGFTTGKSAAGRQSRAVDIRGTTTALQRAGARTRNALGMQSKKETLDSRIATYDSIADKVSKMEERAKSQLALKNSNWKICQVKREKLKQDYIDNKINSTDYKDALEQIERQENAMVEQYINRGTWDSNMNKYVKDSDIEVMKKETKRIASENKFTIDGSEFGAEIDINSNWSDFKKIKSTYKNKSRDFKASEEYDDATKVDNYVKSSVGQKHMNS